MWFGEGSRMPLPVFDGTGYNSWRRKLEIFLKGHGMWRICLEEGPKDLVITENGALSEKNSKAMAVIMSSVRLIDQNIIEKYDFARDMLKFLDELHLRNDIATRLKLRRELMNTQMIEGSDAMLFISKVESLICDLERAGGRIDEEEKIGYILGGLPPSYSNFVMMTEQVISMKETVNCNSVISQINLEYSKRLSNQESKKEAAYKAVDSERRKGNHNPKRDRWKDFKCYECGQYGHIKSKCPKNPKGDSLDRNRNNNYNRRDQAIFAYEQLPDDYLFMANEQRKPISTRWIVDSGASSHMTYDKEDFHSMEEIDRVITTASDLKLRAKGIGKVSLMLSNEGTPKKIVLRDVLWVPGIRSKFFSVPAASRSEVSFNFKGDTVMFSHGSTEVILGNKGSVCNLYTLKLEDDELEQGASLYEEETASLQEGESTETEFDPVHETEVEQLCHESVQLPVGVVKPPVGVLELEESYTEGNNCWYQDDWNKEYEEEVKPAAEIKVREFIESTPERNAIDCRWESAVKGGYGNQYGNIGTRKVTGTSDSDWAKDTNDWEETSSYGLMLNDDNVSCSSQQQQTLTLSTEDAEEKMLSQVHKEELWLKVLKKTLELGVALKGGNENYGDNQVNFGLEGDSTLVENSKYSSLRYSFVKDAVEKTMEEISCVNTESKSPDVFTNASLEEQFELLRGLLGVEPVGGIKGSPVGAHI
jgi:hypothetical protein